MEANEIASKNVDQIHQYVRHVFQLLFVWFTFFATVNYAAMGLVADSEIRDIAVLWTIAIMFIAQNGLGICACYFAYCYVAKVADELRLLEGRILGEADSTSMPTIVPTALYRNSILLMIVALVIIVVGWFVLPGILS